VYEPQAPRVATTGFRHTSLGPSFSIRRRAADGYGQCLNSNFLPNKDKQSGIDPLRYQLKKNTEEYRMNFRGCIFLLGSHIYSNFGDIRYNV